MQRGKRILARLFLQKVSHRIVKAEGSTFEVEREQKRQARKSEKEILCPIDVFTPKHCGDHDGHVHILRKVEFLEARALGCIEQVEAQIDCER